MARRAAALSLTVVAALSWAGSAAAFPPERRFEFAERTPNQYLIIPAVASLPGIGVFAGVILSASNVGGTGIELGGTYAESIDSTDIKVRALALREVPLLPSRMLTLEYQVADIKLGNFQNYVPGRNSPNFTIPVTGQLQFQLLRPTLNLFARRLKASYNLGFVNGFEFDEDGNELTTARHSSGFQVSLDLTDSEVNPKQGVFAAFSTSLDAPEVTIFGRNSIPLPVRRADLGLVQRRYTLSGYYPLRDDLTLAGSLQYFRTLGAEGRDEVISGGSPPLRGYPGGRWRDRFGVFLGGELRYALPYNDTIDIVLARGFVEEFQIVGFYEVGQVSPSENHLLFEDLHHSFGAGVRVAFDVIVLRFDLGLSDEGGESHLTIDQPF
ncbi:MAG: BamA/TamA family outer membrane protein [Candidatus Lambdaproteobacteria bacterium]|nr:BamA/TamA family outer membrane protein [Candidatus Lambdaproteobacteria bacterium]